MRTKTLTTQSVDVGGMSTKTKKLFGTLALISALACSPECRAQEVVTQRQDDPIKEIVMQQDSTKEDIMSVMDLYEPSEFDSNGGGKGIDIEPDPEGDDTGDAEGQDDGGQGGGQKEKKSGLSAHGFIQVGTGVAADFADVCSDKPTLITGLDVSHQKSGLGLMVLRLDDFNDDMDHPVSKATVIDLHMDKKFGKDGQFAFRADGKYTAFDKMPGANGFTSDVLLSYTTKSGWTFEGMYAHKFKEGPDSDAFRLSISKKIDEVLKLTAQGRYETGYEKGFYGRVIVDVDLGKGLGAQVSCIAKDGKFVPTAGVIYKF